MAVIRSTISTCGLLLAVSSTACESPLSPGEFRALEMAQSRWTARSFRDYAFEVRRACFCPDLLTQWARVEVQAGRVTRVIILATGYEVSVAERTYFSTVEEVFNFIRNAAGEDWVEDVEITFDVVLGFPTYASFVSKPNIADAGGAYFLRNAVPLP